MRALSAEALAMLRQGVKAARTQAAAARQMGISPPTVSQLLSGTYAGDIAAMERRIIRAFSRVNCPYQRREIAADECVGNRGRAMPTHSPAAMRFWRACQECSIGGGLAGGKDAE